MAPPPKNQIAKAINEARAQLQRRDFSRAHLQLQTLEKRFGPAPIVYNLQAQAHLGMGQRDAAMACLRKSLELMPKQADVLNNLGLMLFEAKQYGEAMDMLEKAVTSSGTPGRFAANAANLFFLMQRFDKAEHYVAIALKEDPTNVKALAVRGFVSDWRADGDAARRDYEAVLKVQPTNADVHFALSSLIDYTQDHPHIRQMRTVLNRTRFKPGDESQIRFGLGNALERSGQYEEAYGEFVRANDLRRSEIEFDIDAERRHFQKIARDLPDRDNALSDLAPLRNRRPLFIVGLPRSGTTLTEQILGGHSQVSPQGELGAMLKAVNKFPPQTERPSTEWLMTIRNYYLSQTRPSEDEDVQWYSDKRPINYRNVGYILSAFPEGKVIHIRRHPFHTCWSIFKRPFAGDGLEFTSNLDDLLGYYSLYSELMDAWEAQFPDRFMTVVYEELVAQPDAQINRMLDFLGLDHEDGLLSFHKAGRMADSASRYQVQQPIFTNSADKAERFRPFVPEFASALDAMAIDANLGSSN